MIPSCCVNIMALCETACSRNVLPVCGVLSGYVIRSSSAAHGANRRFQATGCGDRSSLVCPAALLSEPQHTDLRVGDRRRFRQSRCCHFAYDSHLMEKSCE